MSGLTSELALGTAVGSDDTANYLTITLANALNTIDGEFSAATGHNHNGAHQGGVLHFSNLLTNTITFDNGATLGPFATGNQLRFQSTNVSFSGNATIDGTLTAANATISGTMTMSGPATLTSLTVTGASTFTGLVNANGGVGASSITTSGRITSGTDLVVGNGFLYLGSLGDTSISRASAGVVATQSLSVLANLSVGGTSTFTGVATHNQDVVLTPPRTLNFGGGGAQISPGTNVGDSANTVYISSHGRVFFDFTVGHTVTCQNLVQTSDMSLKSGAAVMTDDACIARVRNPGVSVYTYQLAPPAGGDSPPENPVPTPTEIGFDAAQVYAASPEFAALKDGTPVGVNYSNMAALLWGALRQLDTRVQALEA